MYKLPYIIYIGYSTQILNYYIRLYWH